MIATVAGGTDFDHPAISANLIVWAEETSLGKTIKSTIRAYDRQLGTTRIVDEFIGTSNFAISGYRVVWTNPRLQYLDVLSGIQTTLTQDSVGAPSIFGDTVLWSGYLLEDNSGDTRIYKRDLKTGTTTALAVASRNQQRPVLVGNDLVWQSEDTLHWEVKSVPSAQAFVALDKIPTSNLATNLSTNISTSPIKPFGTTNGYNTYKGMHVANANGWFNADGSTCNANGCAAIDALGSSTGGPKFGSYVVLDSDLDKCTGRSWPGMVTPNNCPGGAGTVSDAMRFFQSKNAVVIVRTWPTEQPQYGVYNSNVPFSGSGTPDDTALQVVHDAQRYDWIRNIQVNNEPNEGGEWADCPQKVVNGVTYTCEWGAGSNIRLVSYTGLRDPNRYGSIDMFYSDTWWWAINYYKSVTIQPRNGSRYGWTRRS